MTFVFLIAAIISEVTATLSLRMAYLAAFAFLTLALDAGLTIGVAYGIWTACGVALTAIASRILFREPLTKLMIVGIGLIAAGVLLIELGAAH